MSNSRADILRSFIRAIYAGDTDIEDCVDIMLKLVDELESSAKDDNSYVMKKEPE